MKWLELVSLIFLRLFHKLAGSAVDFLFFAHAWRVLLVPNSVSPSSISILTRPNLPDDSNKNLGECWNFIIQKEPRYKEDNSAPYPTIAEKAAGRFGRIMVNCTVYVTLFMACVVIWILCYVFQIRSSDRK